MVNSNLPPNMTEGSDVKVIDSKDLSVEEAISECFEYIKSKVSNDGVLFIVENLSYYTQRLEKLLECQCKNKIFPIIMDYLLEKEGRPSPVFHVNEYSSGKEKVKNWMINSPENQDAVVERDLAKGIERHVVVVFDDSHFSPEFISRSNGIAILCKIDWFLSTLCLVDSILRDKNHDCESMLDRNSSRPQINLDIGNQFLFYFVLIPTDF